MSVVIPDIALSILQPWAALIVRGVKHIENRTWREWNAGLKFRGRIAIHAGKGIDTDALGDLLAMIHPAAGRVLLPGEIPATDIQWVDDNLHRGGIVGVADIVDCVTEHDSPWFVGKYGFIIENAEPVEFIPTTGALGFFDWKKIEATAQRKRAEKAAA